MLGTFWEIFQYKKISEAGYRAEKSEVMSHANLEGITHLRNQIDTLVLANQAMWEIVSEKHGLTEHHLLTKMNEIDLRDGKLDGKLVKTHLTTCPDCNRQISKQRANCYWCGAKVAISSPFAP
ncbi:hypothetical protein [Aurantivibrio plasticivorans]